MRQEVCSSSIRVSAWLQCSKREVERQDRKWERYAETTAGQAWQTMTRSLDITPCEMESPLRVLNKVYHHLVHFFRDFAGCHVENRCRKEGWKWKTIRGHRNGLE